MDLCFDEWQDAYRVAVRKFCTDVLAPIVDSQYDFRSPLRREDVQIIAKSLAGYDIATEPPLTESGELDLLLLGVFIEEVSRVDVAFGSLANALFFQVWDMAQLCKTDRQKEMFAPMFLRGETVAFALSEPEAASNPSEIRTKARFGTDGWSLDGLKTWTSHATIASGILVAARKDGAPVDDGEISLFMVDPRSPGCSIGAIDTIGWAATTLCEVQLSDCLVPFEAELTPGKGGLRAGLSLVEQGRIKIIFISVGIAQAALDKAVAYAKERTQSGRPLASFQLVQEMLAEMSTIVEASRLLGYRAASLMMRGQSARAEISRAKWYSTEGCVRVASLGIQVHGAMGLTREAGAEKLFRDARMLTIPDGTTEIHKLVIGRALTGVDAFR